MERDDAAVDERTKKIKNRIEKAIKKGNVDRIRISKGNDTILNIPVNVGVVGGIIGLATFPWVVILGTVATIGYGCKIEIVKKEGDPDSIIVDDEDEEN